MIKISKRFFLAPLILMGSIAHAATNYKTISENSTKLLEKLINGKPITGCESEVQNIIESRLKELNLNFELIVSGDAPATLPPTPNDPALLCKSGKAPAASGFPNYIIKIPANVSPKKGGALMVVAHMDVVPAAKQKWVESADPHTATSKNGYIYGRGTMDMLSYLTTAIELFGEIKNTQQKLNRDLILMLNSAEETGGMSGMGWLVKNRPELFDGVELALSEGGFVSTDSNHAPLYIGYESGQKLPQNFKITAKGPSAHSSKPTKDSAFNMLMDALTKIRTTKAIPRLIPLVKSYFKERAKVEPDQKLAAIMRKLGNAPDVANADISLKYQNEIRILEADYPQIHALIRTTCLSTVVTAGNDSSKNVQPTEVTANVNCRLMPDESVDSLLPMLQKMINSTITKKSDKPGEPDTVVASVTIELDALDMRPSHGGVADLNGVIPKELAILAKGYFKGIPVIPSMLTGATDLRYLRKRGIAAYGLAAGFFTDADVARSHGLDERVYEANITAGAEFFHKVLSDLSSPSTKSPASVETYQGPISHNFKDAFKSEKHSHVEAGCAH